MKRTLAAIALCALSTAAHAQIARLGAMGDSLTDEYADDTFSYATNWTMQIVQFRGLNMGPTAAAASQPGGTWGEPRRTGYKYNWCRYGDDSISAVTNGQHTSLAAQAVTDGVAHAVVEIGSNDFAPTSSAYFNIYWGLWSQSQTDNYVNARIASINTAVTTLDNAGMKLIVCNYADFGVTPVVRQLYPTASRRNRVTAAIAQCNAGVLNIARQHHAVFVDINSLGSTIFGTNTSLRQFLPIGNVNIQLFNRDTTGHTNPLAGVVDDGAHPHTTLQGVFANTMMTALNVLGRTGYTLFSDQEILAHAGVPYGGSDTLDGVVGAGGYKKYVRNFRCLADLGSQGGIAGPDGIYDNNDFIVFIDAFFAQSLTADLGRQGGLAGGDSILDNNDFVAFIDQFFQGCN
jgi:hypothetical protein